MINAINDIIFPILLFLLIYSFLWEFVPDFPNPEIADPIPAIKEAFSAANDPEPLLEPSRVALTPEPVLEPMPEPVLEPISEPVVSEKINPEPNGVCPVESLPSTIRALRQYIREYNLQEVIKQRTGKTVSQCVKEELIAALAI